MGLHSLVPCNEYKGPPVETTSVCLTQEVKTTQKAAELGQCFMRPMDVILK